jgi:crotonobetainyl-CoA:carnitine CoA-transferase CaiB-like acyl-CoA transferase
LKQIFTEIFQSRDLNEWIDIFKDSDACVFPVLTLDEAKSQLSIPRPTLLPSIPHQMTESKSNVLLLPGKDTRQVLLDHGFSITEIDQLLREQVVQQAPSSHL